LARDTSGYGSTCNRLSVLAFSGLEGIRWAIREHTPGAIHVLSAQKYGALPKLKITDAVVARTELPDGKSDMILWDTEVTGFGLRVRPGGKTWLVGYRPLGAGRSTNMRWLKLGTLDAVPSTSSARNMARVALGKVASGGDPMAERRVQKQREKTTLSELLERYEADLQRRNYVNHRTVINGLRTKMHSLLSRDVREITGADLATIMERLEKGGRPGAGRDFRSRCRAFFGWCVTKPKVLTANPLAGFRKERPTRADRIATEQHGRALTDEELVKVWNAADPSTSFGRLIRFYILTGCRRGEGAGLTWAMVDRRAEVIDLPAVFTKQGRGHLVPISPALAEVLDACPVMAGSDLVFASSRSGGKMGGWTQLTAKINKASGVAFNLHDLRRTFRTGLSRLAVDTETAELALGHARSDLEAVYNRDRATGALRRAFESWSDHVLEISGRLGGVFA
jgi:integrase